MPYDKHFLSDFYVTQQPRRFCFDSCGDTLYAVMTQAMWAILQHLSISKIITKEFKSQKRGFHKKENLQI